MDTTTPPLPERRRLLRERVRLPCAELDALCRRYSVRRLAFFGSVLRHDFTPASDLDVLVEFLPGVSPGLDFFGLEIELSELFQRRVDLNTAGFLSPYFRTEVLAEAEDVYDAS